ncbi:hypothetical protein [Streptococcus suis]|uniref:hypothetical protein n=1 Tax=Streptococcus suis TaxID=1307 RepID=UPI00209C2569|nr:hypothetical protein [Streptococcus suis]MCO8231827.1 hypothetical protein [Streptococcus suis]HEM3540899.1 hypothetical protein [Streptococcus suis]
MRIKELYNNIMLTQYEREQIEAVAKLTNLKILDNREYLKSYSVAQREQSVLRLFLYVVFLTVVLWVGRWLPDTILNSLPMMILLIVLGLFWFFIVFYKFCDFLLSLTGFRVKIPAILLSWIMNAFLLTHLLFGSTLLSGENQKFLQELFTEFTLCKSDDMDFWIIFGVTIVPLWLFVILSLRNIKIFELENIIKYLDVFSILLAIVTFVFNISYIEANIIGIFLFFLLIETLLTSFLANKKLKEIQLEADNIFRKELLKTHPVYANLKRCYVFGGETYQDKMLSNEKMYRTILRNESAIVCNAKRLKIIVSNPKRNFNKLATLKLKYPTVWIVKEEPVKSFFERKNRQLSASKWTRLKLWLASVIRKQTR